MNPQEISFGEFKFVMPHALINNQEERHLDQSWTAPSKRVQAVFFIESHGFRLEPGLIFNLTSFLVFVFGLDFLEHRLHPVRCIG